MGRHAGFIAAHATLASGEVDLCLVPEVTVELEGTYGVLPHIERVLTVKGKAVIVVAEGAGEELCGAAAGVYTLSRSHTHTHLDPGGGAVPTDAAVGAPPRLLLLRSTRAAIKSSLRSAPSSRTR